ncbi:MAG: AAA family ATPase [Myxococcales bacterium]|nr:AAA family ATPase [Myxococcales bacterium]
MARPCHKSWLGLDLALSVASATPCLGRFEVRDPGPVLLYLAEDAPGVVKQRLAGLCAPRGLEPDPLPIHVVTAPSLRLTFPSISGACTDARRPPASPAGARPLRAPAPHRREQRRRGQRGPRLLAQCSAHTTPLSSSSTTLARTPPAPPAGLRGPATSTPGPTPPSTSAGAAATSSSPSSIAPCRPGPLRRRVGLRRRRIGGCASRRPG